MLVQKVLEVEVFSCWGIHFMGLFPSSHFKDYIFVVVDFVSKWDETVQKNNVKTMTKFLKTLRKMLISN